MKKRRGKRDKVKNPYGNAEDVVFRNIEDPIVALYRRKNGSIGEAQFAAACRYREAYLTLGGQLGMAIDYGALKVDTSGRPEVFTERQAIAASEVANCHEALTGPQRAVLVCVVGEYMTLAETAYRGSGSRSAHHQRATKQLLLDALDELADLYGYSGRSKPVRVRTHQWRERGEKEYPEQEWSAYAPAGRKRKGS